MSNFYYQSLNPQFNLNKSFAGFLSVCNNFIFFPRMNGLQCYLGKLVSMFQMTFINDTGKAAQANVVTRKQKNELNDYIYHVCMTGFCFELSAV